MQRRGDCQIEHLGCAADVAALGYLSTVRAVQTQGAAVQTQQGGAARKGAIQRWTSAPVAAIGCNVPPPRGRAHLHLTAF